MTKATLKWFNPRKGFGFVTPEDGSPDAFLHISVVEQSGHSTFSDGTIIECEISQGQKGPQVDAIISVDAATNIIPETTVVEGTVKWFNWEKGFGFIQQDSGGRDVFVHVRALEQAGITALAEGQRVRLGTSDGKKGPQAETIEII
jgi:cold shock protein